MKTDKSTAKWHKQMSPMTPEQVAISNDFMRCWLAVLPQSLSPVDKFNQCYVVDNSPEGFLRTLEIGVGNGEHRRHERLDDTQRLN